MNISKIVALALNEAEVKLSVGKLIKSVDDFDWMDSKNYVDGDPETIYSLTTLYSNFAVDVDEEQDKLEDAIETALMEKYPDYV